MKRIGIIGSGHVGDTLAFTLAQRGLGEEVLLYDVKGDKSFSESLDLEDGFCAYPTRTRVRAVNLDELKDTDIVVVASGRIPEGHDRLEELALNREDVRHNVGRLVQKGFRGIFIVITNPVDIMGDVVLKASGFPPSRVLATGTALDSARLSVLLGKRFKVDPRSIAVQVMGEHGESQFIPWSTVRVGGLSLEEFLRQRNDGLSVEERKEFEEKTRKRGWEIFKGKGSTQYGIASRAADLAAAILGDEHRVLLASVLLEGEYGLDDVFLSTPVIVGKNGVEERLELPLTSEEKERLHQSADLLRLHRDGR